MTVSIDQIEFDRTLPDALLAPAWQAAARERPANLPAYEATALTGRLWANGRTLSIAFVEDALPPDLRKSVPGLVQQYAGRWLEHANLTFAWGAGAEEAEIRIGFDPGVGNWSYIGTDALAFTNGEITMNLGALARPLAEEQVRRIVLHEFGHTLGLVHEHQSPAAGIRWNRDAVLRAFAGSPNHWDPEKVEINIFRRYDRTHSQYADLLPLGTAFDRESIMIYRIPPEWTLNEVAYRENTDLSPTDIRFIARCYPRSEAGATP